jgi:hypothetical protein
VLRLLSMAARAALDGACAAPMHEASLLFK